VALSAVDAYTYTGPMHDTPQPGDRSRRSELMLALEAVAPLLVGIAAIAFLALAFLGASSNYP